MHWGRTGVVVAALGVVVAIGIALSQNQPPSTGDGPERASESNQTPSMSRKPDPTPPGVAASESASAPSAQEPALTLTATIDETYIAGKDKAFACPSGDSFCLEIQPLVMGPDGPVEEGCNLRWELYSGKRAAGTPINKGYDNNGVYPCAPDSSVDVVLPDIKGLPLDPGFYTFMMYAELNDGTTGKGSYQFELVDRG